jgi:hypothetical protein
MAAKSPWAFVEVSEEATLMIEPINQVELN